MRRSVGVSRIARPLRVITGARLAGAAWLAACSGSSPSGPTAVVIAMAGDRAAGGATVISHRADGTRLDETSADAVGHAELRVEPGALVSVVFAASASPASPAAPASIVTTLAPETGELVIHGPPVPRVPAIVGGLAITAPPLAADLGYDIGLGCATIAVPTLPTTVEVAAACLGSDTQLDVLVRGYQAAADGLPPVVIGYAAARVPLVDGLAHLDLAAWQTATLAVPTVLDGVAPGLTLVTWADGLPFPAPAITDHAALWTDLAVDSTTLTATLGFPGLAQVTRVEGVGLLAGVALGPADFVPQLEATLALADRATLAVAWSATGAAGAAADALVVRLAWSELTPVIWEVVLPPTADHVTFPQLDGGPFALPTSATTVIDARLQALDSSALAGFTELLAVGLDATSTTGASPIVPRPLPGEVRTTYVTGLP